MRPAVRGRGRLRVHVARSERLRPRQRGQDEEGGGALHRCARPPGHPRRPPAAGAGKASVRSRSRSAARERLVGEEHHAGRARFARGVDLLEHAAEGQPVGADPGPEGRGRPQLVAGLLDLGAEELRVGRVGHRADGVEDAARHPGRPGLVVLVAAPSTGPAPPPRRRRARVASAVRPRQPHGEVVEDGAPVLAPAFGIERGRGEQVAATPSGAEALERRAATSRSRGSDSG